MERPTEEARAQDHGAARRLLESWDKYLAAKLTHPEAARGILETLDGHAPHQIFDLLFYATFSHRILTVMRREGKDTEGFARMQQSFRDGVEQVRTHLAHAAALGAKEAHAFTELTAAGMQRLLELTADLAWIKEEMDQR